MCVCMSGEGERMRACVRVRACVRARALEAPQNTTPI